jgi:hypothetical protein
MFWRLTNSLLFCFWIPAFPEWLIHRHRIPQVNWKANPEPLCAISVLLFHRFCMFDRELILTFKINHQHSDYFAAFPGFIANKVQHYSAVFARRK